ncbi:molybdopterin synthase catalytic subunit [Sphingomonas sp. HMWF008]|nr:molybdopterin synthase catalytic subunit [Sphingomonas sp. HMWF008]
MITVGPSPIDVGAEYAAIAVRGAGGVATFVGLVRADDGVATLELEHYPGATEGALAALAAEARQRWDLIGARITHRVGVMVPGDVVVFVGTAAAHRAAALEACAFLIDRLKTDAPFWKKETRGGAASWVEPRGSDDAAAARWSA